MEHLENVTGIVAALDRSNIDTDAIIPKQYLKSIRKFGFGENLFDAWRYLDHGEPGQDHSKRPLNPDFVLNQARYRDTRILLAGDNFGCGSSREHAAWAFRDYGIRVIIAPSFADIFNGNALKNGLLPVVLDETTVARLIKSVEENEGYILTIDLPSQRVITPDGEVFNFEIDAFRKHCLINGLDDIDMTLTHADEIHAYETRRREEAPWLFTDL
ncbi:MAG: 3-isopropylmalate dehydratase small subunit [marine bacterium B5-7]|nr:MAG: 3-isopropylmalate dehydratase small subunit [marine bacterium B5-7]